MSGYRESVGRLLAEGWEVADVHASGSEAGRSVRAVLLGPAGETRLETCRAPAGTVPSLADLAPAVVWDEREARDRFGLEFDGITRHRPLLDHDLDLARWTTTVRGDDAYQVAVGPIHAGVIESGHFRFHLVGEKILHLDTRLFYKHRGLERAAEGRTLGDGLAYVSRACAACTVASGVAYAFACEQISGQLPHPDVAHARTVLLELERVWSHLNDVAAMCAGCGLAAGATTFAALTERARRLDAELTGHRFLFGSVSVGGSALALGAEQIAAARAELQAIGAAAARGWRELVFNRSFVDRLPDIGLVDAAAVRRLGTVGPAARAAGVAVDARTHAPALAYDGFAAVVPERSLGDVQARFEQRELELRQSLAILDGLLTRPVVPAVLGDRGDGQEVGVGVVESPRGRTVCIVEARDATIERLRLRTGSYANWPSVAFAAADNMLPDFPLINKSFELCYACVDR